MQFDLEQCTDKKKWDCFVKHSPQGNVFCLTAFLDSLNVDYDTWLLSRPNSDSIGGAVVLKDKNGCVMRAPSPFTMYHGLLLGQVFRDLPVHRRINETMEVTTAILDALEREYDRISLHMHPEFEDLRAISWFHYHEAEKGQPKISLYYTGIIDIADFDEYLTTIRPCKRREYRLAQKNGMIAETSNDVALLETLFKATFQRQGIVISNAELQLIKSIASSAIAKGYGELLVARLPNGEAASAALFLHDAHTGYYLIGANHPEHRNTYGGIFVVLESIRRCHLRGIRSIDVCGINSPSRGDFKISLNAAPKPYFLVNWQRPA